MLLSRLYCIDSLDGMRLQGLSSRQLAGNRERQASCSLASKGKASPSFRAGQAIECRATCGSNEGFPTAAEGLDLRARLTCSSSMRLMCTLAHVLLLSVLWLTLAAASAAAEQCPISIDYGASLGPGGMNSDIPVFAGSMEVHNHDPLVNVTSWQLGWNFSDGEYILNATNIASFGFPLQPIVFSGSNIILQSQDNNVTNGTNALDPGNGTYRLQFTGQKGSHPANTSNPYLIAPLEDVAFNNLRCAQLPQPPVNVTAAAAAATQIATPKIPNIDNHTSSVYIEYTPIEYVSAPLGAFATSFTQFLSRITNIASLANVSLKDLTFQYWFDGPEGVDTAVGDNPNDLFELQCVDATTDCTTVTSNFSIGLQGVPGARFVLNVGFTADAGYLVQLNESMIEEVAATVQHVAGDLAVQVQQVLLNIQSKQLGLLQMNQTQDYSYLNTTISSLNQNTSQIVPRIPAANWRIPAYLNDTLVWGSPPMAVAGPPAPAAVLPTTTLPPGISCALTSNRTVQVCGVSVSYCCNSSASVSADIPATFPPPLPETLAPASAPGAAPAPEAAPAPGAAPTQSPQAQAQNAQATSQGHSSSSALPLALGVAGGVGAALLAACTFGLVAVRRRRRRRAQEAALPSKQGSGSDGSSGIALPMLTGSYHEGITPKPPTYQEYRYAMAMLFPEDSEEEETTLVLEDATRGSKLGQTGSHDTGGTAAAFLKNSPFVQPEHPAGATFPEEPGNARMVEIERKALSLPLRWGSTGSAPQPSAGLRQPVKDCACSNRCPESETDAAAAAVPAPDPLSALRRAQTWGGPYAELPSLELLHLARRHGHHVSAQPLQQALRLLPSMSMSPAVTTLSAGGQDVDLDVDFDKDIKPFLGNCLGTGGFGAVYECVWRGRTVAVKCLPPLNSSSGITADTQYEALVREIRLSSRFRSKRLVKVLGACLGDAEKVCLIMELVEGGNLAQRIYDRNKRRMTYLEILQLAHDVSAGLAYLHPTVVHRDLKPQNILLDRNGRAKIADFGISKVKDPAKSYLSATTDARGPAPAGTPMYMAPEQFNGTRVDEKVDVFALGCILNECYSRRQPWQGCEHFFQIIMCVAINGERPRMEADMPEPLRRLIRRCWAQDTRQRLSCAEIMRLAEIMIREAVKQLLPPSPLQRGHTSPNSRPAAEVG